MVGYSEPKCWSIHTAMQVMLCIPGITTCLSTTIVRISGFSQDKKKEADATLQYDISETIVLYKIYKQPLLLETDDKLYNSTAVEKNSCLKKS